MDGIVGPLRARTNPGREPAEHVEIQDAVRFGDWVAAQHGRTEPGARTLAWSIYNLTQDGWMGWRACREVAVEAARLLAERLPVLEPFPSSGTAEERAAHREHFGSIWEPIMRAALSIRAPKPARPFVVEVKRVEHLLIFAESFEDADDALRGLDRDDLDAMLQRGDLEIGDSEERGAADACHTAGISFDPKGYHDEAERYFWAVGGRLFRPDTSPAQLYMAPGEFDHAYRCPARPRPSLLFDRDAGRPAQGAVMVGACNCDARVFPGPPAT